MWTINSSFTLLIGINKICAYSSIILCRRTGFNDTYKLISKNYEWKQQKKYDTLKYVVGTFKGSEVR